MTAVHAIEEVMVHLAVAAVLGATVAHRPWRLLMRGRPPVPPATAQAQTVICVAAALMVVVIGDSTARAFGLVGLGAFIRFRSGIRDPRDAAVLFVMIAVGMASGLGAYRLALLGMAFATALLVLFDLRGMSRTRAVRVKVKADDPRLVLGALRAAFPGSRVVEAASSDAGRLVLALDGGAELDAGRILEALEKNGVPGVRQVALDED